MCTVQDFDLLSTKVLASVLTDEQATHFYQELHALLAKYPPQSGSQDNDPQLKQLAHYNIGGY